MIRFACSKCGKTFRVPDSYAGKPGKCGRCGNAFTAPTFVPSTVPPVAARHRSRWPLAPILLMGIVIGAIGIGLAKSVILDPQAMNGSGSELNRKIYECYRTHSMRTGTDGQDYFDTPSRIVILSVEQREKVNPRNEGTPYYVKVRVHFNDWTSRENDEWAFFVMDDKSVEYTPWGSLMWSNFFLDAAEGKLPPIEVLRPVQP